MFINPILHIENIYVNVQQVEPIKPNSWVKVVHDDSQKQIQRRVCNDYLNRTFYDFNVNIIYKVKIYMQTVQLQIVHNIKRSIMCTSSFMKIMILKKKQKQHVAFFFTKTAFCQMTTSSLYYFLSIICLFLYSKSSFRPDVNFYEQ